MGFAMINPSQTTLAADHTYTVTMTEDSGPGSLRWAINQANTHVGSGDTVLIEFDLAEGDPNFYEDSGVWTIAVNSALPILIAGNTTIDGYSQEGAQYATEYRSPTLVVELNGTNVPPISNPPTVEDLLKSGLNIASANNIITGLLVTHFPLHGIAIAGTAANYNSVVGTCIGTSYQCAHDEGNEGDGVYIGLGAKHNWIGGGIPESKNIILFNGFDGVGIEGNGTTGNHIQGNIIMANDIHGVRIYAGAHENMIGGSEEFESNIISANDYDGVRIQGSGTNGNVIAGNFIGTSGDGIFSYPNGFNGIQITLGAQKNLIGGRATGSRNLISGNVESGVLISSTNTINNTVVGNLIGTNYDGTEALANQYGVQICCGAQHNLIGGGIAEERNIVSGNIQHGIYLTDPGTSHNVIAGNYIGTDISGSGGIENSGYGVCLRQGASDNLIGGDTPEERNVISGNRLRGLHLIGVGTNSNIISGNFIGTTSSGLVPLGNGNYGIMINGGAQDNTVGGSSEGEGNVISANDDGGIVIGDSMTSGNIVAGNTIGVGADGSAPLGNMGNGISVSKALDGDTIGPGNVIGYNLGSGVKVNHSSSLEVIITQNRIFKNIEGITIEDGANGGIYPPVILSATDDGEVSGTTCGDCIIEVFWNHLTDRQGEVYLDTTTANSAGEFSLTLPWRVDFNLTATATDLSRGTSAFSEPFRPLYMSYLPITMNGE
jgi:hypothetical protein